MKTSSFRPVSAPCTRGVAGGQLMALNASRTLLVVGNGPLLDVYHLHGAKPGPSAQLALPFIGSVAVAAPGEDAGSHEQVQALQFWDDDLLAVGCANGSHAPPSLRMLSLSLRPAFGLRGADQTATPFVVRRLWRHPVEAAPSMLCFHPSGRSLLSVIGGALLFSRWEARSPSQVSHASCEGAGPGVVAVDFSRSGSVMASVAEGGQLVVWAVVAGAPLPEPRHFLSAPPATAAVQVLDLCTTPTPSTSTSPAGKSGGGGGRALPSAVALRTLGRDGSSAIWAVDRGQWGMSRTYPGLGPASDGGCVLAAPALAVTVPPPPPTREGDLLGRSGLLASSGEAQWVADAEPSSGCCRVWPVRNVPRGCRNNAAAVGEAWPALEQMLNVESVSVPGGQVRGLALFSPQGGAVPGLAADDAHDCAVLAALSAQGELVVTTFEFERPEEALRAEEERSAEQLAEEEEARVRAAEAERAEREVEEAAARARDAPNASLAVRYRVPRVRSRAAASGSASASGSTSGSTATSTSADAVTRRMGELTKRLGAMESDLDQLRVSFGLFTTDVNVHMDLMRQALEKVVASQVSAAQQ